MATKKIKLTHMQGNKEIIEASDLWAAPSLLWDLMNHGVMMPAQKEVVHKVHNIMCALLNGKVEVNQCTQL